jgi:TRAP-type C4-dicarboxylate transport system substrate-binding protein
MGMVRILAVMLTAVGLLWAAVAAAEPVSLKLSFFASDTDANYVKVIKPWVDIVNADPSGAVKIEAFPNGALGKNPMVQPQLLLDGVTDIALVNPSLTPGRFLDDQVFELPGLIKSVSEGVQLYQTLVMSDSLRGYSDYYVIGSFMNPNYNIFARRPIKSIQDLKGMKVRILGPVIGQTVKELVMVPILMAPNDIVEALGRGTIDATTAVPSGVVDFGVDRVTRYDFLLPLGAGPLTVLMSRAKFESMPRVAQETIAKYSLKFANELFIKQLGNHHDDIIDRFKADPKRTVVVPSQADLDAVKPVYEKVTLEWAAKDPRNAALLAKARATLAQIRAK